MLAPLVSNTGEGLVPGDRALAPGTRGRHRLADSRPPEVRAFRSVQGHFRCVHRRLRSRPGVAEPLGDDRDAHGIPAGPRVRRAMPAGLAGTASWAVRLRSGRLVPAEHASGHAALDRRGRDRQARARSATRLARAGCSALSVLVVLSPWMIRNFVVFGEPVWTTTHGGYTLALANNPVYYREVLHGPPGGSGRATTSGSGGIRSTARRPACPSPQPTAT